MSISILVQPLGVENLKRARTALESLAGALASRATDKIRASIVDALPLSPFNLTQVGGTSLTARDWSQDFAKLQNLDTTLSSRASESTLSAIAGALASKATDKLRVSVVDVLPRSPFYLTDSAGTELSSYIKNLDTALSGVKASVDSIKGALASVGTDKLMVTVVDALPRSPFTPYDSAGNELSSYIKNLDTALSAVKASIDSVNLAKVSGTALTARDWSQDFAKLQNLDVALSTRASESTLSAFSGKFPSAVALADNLSNPSTTIVGSALLGFDGTYWRRVAVDTSRRLKVNAEVVANPPNLDVALSTRASESTLSAIAGALASRATDKLRVSVVDALPESPFNLAKVAGTALTGRDWSADFAKLQNLDVALSTRASESTLSAIAGALASKATDKLRVSVVDALPESPLNLTKVAGTALTARDWSLDFAKLQNLDIALSAHRDAILSKLDELGRLVLVGSTTTPLGANASWVSPVDSDPATGRIVGSVYADQAGTICVEQSPDGSNWDVVDCFSVSAGSGIGFSVEKVCAHARVRYMNGATAQTVFRLYVYKRLRVV